MHLPINFIIDPKAAIDIIENIPTKYKEKQFLLHLDTVLKIEEILKQRTAKTLFTHCYSHVKDHEGFSRALCVEGSKRDLSIEPST